MDSTLNLRHTDISRAFDQASSGLRIFPDHFRFSNQPIRAFPTWVFKKGRKKEEEGGNKSSPKCIQYRKKDWRRKKREVADELGAGFFSFPCCSWRPIYILFPFSPSIPEMWETEKGKRGRKQNRLFSDLPTPPSHIPDDFRRWGEAALDEKSPKPSSQKRAI